MKRTPKSDLAFGVFFMEKCRDKFAISAANGYFLKKNDGLVRVQ